MGERSYVRAGKTVTFDLDSVTDADVYYDEDIPKGMTLNDFISLDIPKTVEFWTSSGFKKVEKDDWSKIVPSTYVKYITKRNNIIKARIGGHLMVVDKDYFVLRNVRNNLSWSVQWNTLVDIYVGDETEFNTIEANRRLKKSRDKIRLKKEKKFNLKKEKEIKQEKAYIYLIENYFDSPLSGDNIYTEIYDNLSVGEDNICSRKICREFKKRQKTKLK